MLLSEILNAYIVSSQMNSLSKLVFQISIEKLYLLFFHEQWYFRSLNECSQNLRRFLSVVSNIPGLNVPVSAANTHIPESIPSGHRKLMLK